MSPTNNSSAVVIGSGGTEVREGKPVIGTLLV